MNPDVHKVKVTSNRAEWPLTYYRMISPMFDKPLTIQEQQVLAKFALMGFVLNATTRKWVHEQLDISYFHLSNLLMGFKRKGVLLEDDTFHEVIRVDFDSLPASFDLKFMFTDGQ